MATTTNKGYELIATGGEVDAWGATLNTDVFTIVDRNMGGITSKTLAASNIVLTTTESQNCILRLAGILSASVQITTSCNGFFFVENLTSGSFSVTITNGVAGVTIPQGNRVVCVADTTNGVRIFATSDFPTGTACVFPQTLAPTGWTKSTTHNNKALRVVNGTAGSGGTTPFTDVFTARTLTRANLPSDNINCTVNQSAHSHTLGMNIAGGNIGAGGVSFFSPGSGATTGLTTPALAVAFNLNGSVPQTTIDFAVQYVDVIIAMKN